MPPYYFIQTDNPATVFNERDRNPFAKGAEFFARHGLACVVANPPGVQLVRAAECHGVAGVLLCVAGQDGELPPKPGYFPDEQDWKKVRNANAEAKTGAIWIGWDKGQPPRPEDLLHGNPASVHGPEMELSEPVAEGLERPKWIVAEIREPVAGDLPLPSEFHRPNLPETIGYDLDGNLSKACKAEYANLWEESADWFDLWVEFARGEADSFELDDALKFAVKVLQLRYRMPQVLADALGLIDNQQVQSIIATAIGWETFETACSNAEDEADEQKKSTSSDAPASDSDNMNGDFGSGVYDPTTAPLAENSPPQSSTAEAAEIELETVEVVETDPDPTVIVEA